METRGQGGLESRRLRLLVVSLGALIALLAWSSPALARVNNVIPATADGDPTDTFRADEALFVYATPDVNGGFICVVNAALDDVSSGKFTCEGDRIQWGSPNFVFGGALIFQPLEAPFLHVGTWRLLGDGGDQPGDDTLSQPFTVTPCADTCDPTFGQASVNEWKSAAAGMKLITGTICSYYAVQSAISDIQGTGAKANAAREAITDDLTMILKKGAKARVRESATLELVLDWSGAEIGIPSPDFNNSDEMALALLKTIICRASAMYGDIEADPADPNFTTIQQPSFDVIPNPDFPGTPSTPAQALATSIERQRGFGRAELKAYERYLGAVDANATPFVHAQSLAISDFGGSLVKEMLQTALLLRQEADLLAADTDFLEPVIPDQATLDTLAAVYQRVRTTGFTLDEITQLQSEGFTAGEIAQLRAGFDVVDLAKLQVGVSLKDVMDNAATDMEAEATTFDAFEREASSVAGVTNQPPAVAFTATPTSGAAPLDVSFTDTSTSPDLDPIMSVTWDFGDGGTGEGSSISHTYTAEGTYTVTETVSDYLASSTATKQIIVGVNHPPIAADDSLTTAQDTAGMVNVLANDSDPDGDALAVTGWTDGAHGTVSCGLTGLCFYTPASGYTGPDSFTYTVSDGRGGTATGTVAVSITPNQPPSAAEDSLRTLQDHSGRVSVLANDSDPDGDAITLASSSQGAHGTVSCGSTGACTYMPASGYSGSDSFTYTISDGHGGTASATVNVTVLAIPLHTQAEINEAVIRGVQYLDTTQNPDGSFGFSYPVAETALAIVAYGVLDRGDINNLDPTLQDHLRKAVSWLLAQQDQATGAWQGYATYYTGLSLEALAFSPGVDPAIPAAIANGRAYLLSTQNAPPLITGNPFSPDCSTDDHSGSDYYCGGWNYDAGFGRSDESNTGFALTGLALTGGVPPAAAAVNVGWQRHVQEWKATNYYADRNDGGGCYQPGFFCSGANDTGSLVFGYGYDGAAASDPNVHAAIVFGRDVLDEYQLTKPDDVRYSITHYGNEENGTCVIGTADCDWANLGDGGYHYSLWALTKGLGQFIPPDLSDPRNWYPEVVDLLLSEQGNDGSWPQDGRDDGTTIAATSLAVSALRLVGVPHALTVATTGTGSGTVTSTPAGIDCGSDCSETFADGTLVTLTATAAAGSTFAGWSGACSADPCSVIMNEDKSVTATFNLGPMNHPPDAVDDSLTTDQDTAGLVNVLANDTDPDGDALTVTGSTKGAHGTVSCTAAGSCTYTPDSGFSGSDSFTYTVSDGHGGTGTATVSVTVRHVNHPPDAVDDSLTTAQDTAGMVNVLTNDSDPDGDALTVTGSTDGGHGTVSCGLTGLCFYTPASGYTGPDSFTYTISDGHGGTDTATVHVTVLGRKSTSTTYTGGTSVQYSDPVPLSGTLLDTSVTPNVGVGGKQLDFTLGTQTASAGPTGSDGGASTSLVVTQQPGSVTTVQTAFPGDASYLPSGDSDPFTIAKEDCTLTYSGNLDVAPTAMTMLAADLGEPDTSLGDRSNKTVTFTVIGVVNATPQIFTTTTDGQGHASTLVPLPSDVYAVSVYFSGDTYYKSCATTQDAVVTVEAAAAKVTGGGWTSISTGRTNFGFNAIPEAGGLWKGQFQLRSNNNKSKFHASVVSTLSGSGSSATWSGAGTWNGQANYTYTISVVDNGSSGKKKTDTISITIMSPTGAIVFSTSGFQTLKGGNITVH